ncbi:hypothetical protein GCM10027160_47740 [Streptomyces calidiresistens]
MNILPISCWWAGAGPAVAPEGDHPIVNVHGPFRPNRTQDNRTATTIDKCRERFSTVNAHSAL